PADCSEHLSDAVLVANVALRRNHSNLVAGKLGFHLFEAGLIACADDQTAAFGSKSAGDCQPDALGCSGDERGLALKCVLWRAWSGGAPGVAGDARKVR